MRTEIVKYIRDPDDPKVFLGVIVAIGPGKVGWAKTHENDRKNWDRKLGLRIARSRAAAVGRKQIAVENTIPDGFGKTYWELQRCSQELVGTPA